MAIFDRKRRFDLQNSEKAAMIEKNDVHSEERHGTPR
jgi:hypothetical protein